MPLDTAVLSYLRERFRRADAILFTGAGFSRGALNLNGEPLPLGSELAAKIWPLCYPGEPFDPATKLEDVFQVAKDRKVRGLTDLLRQSLSVRADSVPEYYARLFSLPWYRSYTLNIDDLEQAVARQHSLQREPEPLSALRWEDRGTPEVSRTGLQVVHLNGLLDDAPDGITFSPSQYGERLAGQEPLYALCAADVLARPVVFIGTPLDESPLWQHVNMRRRGQTRTRREFRRQSYLISPQLDRARRDLLEREFHVVHLPMTAEEFINDIFPAVGGSIAEGMEVLAASGAAFRPRTDIPRAESLFTAAGPGKSDYLLGRAAEWGDIRDGVAAERDCDGELLSKVRGILDRADEVKISRVLLLAGTAGSGKSTAAMRLALSLTAMGTEVGWLDNSIEIAPLDIRRSAEADSAPRVLIIDDADRYGSELTSILSEITRGAKPPAVVVSMRSGRGVERFADRADAFALQFVEFRMPDLTDRDIGRVLGALEAHRRLGALKGMNRTNQMAAFRDSAGRQILVAMLEATSGRRFEELIVSEMTDLGDAAKSLYATAAVASALRFGLSRDELLLSVGEASNATLESIDSLQTSGLLTVDGAGAVRVRHRVIAEVLTRELARERVLASIVAGLAFAGATKLTRAHSAHHPYARRVRALLNHDWLVEHVGTVDARQVYEEVEALLDWNHHYWLQRGSYELEHGDLQLAENFLNQAFNLAPEDALVLTEYAYLQLRLAVAEPGSAESRRLLQEGLDYLAEAIRRRRQADPHQYHIYGRQVLEWIRRGDVSSDERERRLREIAEKVDEGRKLHPRNRALLELWIDVQSERLGVAATP